MTLNNKLSENIEEAVKKALPLEAQKLLSQIVKFAHKNQTKIYVVGGFVRDILLNRDNQDLDIAVEGDAIPFVGKLAEHLGLEFKFFDRFHTAKLLSDAMTIDFSSTRKETYESNGALPKVQLSNLHDDLHRRDFTINAMAMSLNASNLYKIIDYFNGLQDLEQGLIRVMHKNSFMDDPTRLYRALRFAHRLDFKLEHSTKKLFNTAIRNKAIKTLSTKRVASEISRIFAEKEPHKTFSATAQNQLLSDFSNRVTLPQIPQDLLQIEENLDIYAIYWTCFLSQMPRSFKLDSKLDLGLPHSTRAKLHDGLKAHRNAPGHLKLLSIHDHIKLYHLLNKYYIESLIALAAFLKNKEAENKESLSKIRHYMFNLKDIKPIINGKDLLSKNISTGPHISSILEHILELRLEGRSLTKLEELEIAQQLYKNIQN